MLTTHAQVVESAVIAVPDLIRGEEVKAYIGALFGGDSTTTANLVIVTLITEAALLIVAAQAGFLEGPRVLSNMSRDPARQISVLRPGHDDPADPGVYCAKRSWATGSLSFKLPS